MRSFQLPLEGIHRRKQLQILNLKTDFQAGPKRPAFLLFFGEKHGKILRKETQLKMAYLFNPKNILSILILFIIMVGGVSSYAFYISVCPRRFVSSISPANFGLKYEEVRRAYPQGLVYSQRGKGVYHHRLPRLSL